MGNAGGWLRAAWSQGSGMRGACVQAEFDVLISLIGIETRAPKGGMSAGDSEGHTASFLGASVPTLLDVLDRLCIRSACRIDAQGVTDSDPRVLSPQCGVYEVGHGREFDDIHKHQR
jgi:hypothetical protein